MQRDATAHDSPIDQRSTHQLFVNAIAHIRCRDRRAPNVVWATKGHEIEFPCYYFLRLSTSEIQRVR